MKFKHNHSARPVASATLAALTLLTATAFAARPPASTVDLSSTSAPKAAAKAAPSGPSRNMAATIHVNPVSGLNTNDGESIGSPVLTIANALTKINVGGTIRLAAGNYAEALDIDIDVSIVGPVATPPTAKIRPTTIASLLNANYGTATRPNSKFVVNIGDQTNASSVTPTVSITNVEITGTGLAGSRNLTAPAIFVGLMARPGSDVTLTNTLFTDIHNDTINNQNSLVVGVIDAVIAINNSTITDFGKTAIAGTTTSATPPSSISFVNSTLQGRNFYAEGPFVQLSQNGIQIDEDMDLTITGSTLRDFGVSGAPNPSLGLTKAAIDDTLGYVVLVDDSTNPYNGTYSITGNTFQNVQGIYYGDMFSVYSAASLAAANTFTEGWLSYGDPSIASFPTVWGVRFDDPNAVNYALKFTDTFGVTVGIKAGTYPVSGSLVTPTDPIAFVSSGGPVTINLSGTKPANVTAGAGVTITESNVFPDGDVDGLDNILDRIYASPASKDTDNDGFEDAVEVKFGSNPLFAQATTDADGDGLPDSADPNPANPDSDGDNVADFYEYYQNTDPNSAASKPGIGNVDNADANVVFSDGVKMMRVFVGLETLVSLDNPQNFDVNRDGITDNLDAIIVLNLALNNVNSLPFPQ